MDWASVRAHLTLVNLAFLQKSMQDVLPHTKSKDRAFSLTKPPPTNFLIASPPYNEKL